MDKEGEKKILEFWEKQKIYSKSQAKNIKGKKFYLMDGPPYATGHIHMGTALNKILKDIAMRFHRLNGFNVFDRAGYDTHGLPIEFQIEKEIGTKTKDDIEKFGVKKFIEKCREFATKHISAMSSEFKNLGVWMNFEKPYLTLTDDYIETIWNAFKEADKKGLLYLGKYPIHICPRCETAVAYNEIEYTKLEDTSIFVKFPVKPQKSKISDGSQNSNGILKNEKNRFLIIWTTTPWTLPGNTGVMVNPEFDYQEIEVNNETWILAKDLIEKIMKSLKLQYQIKSTFKGKEIEGLEYINPLAKNLKLNLKNAYKVILSARYVNLEDGTGLVHCAPGHGKEDYEVGKEFGLDMPSPVDINGVLTAEAGKYSGKKAREVDEEIIKDLEKDNMLVYKIKYKHDYPLCWRCKNPLLMVSQPQWFFKISSIHSKLLKNNDNTNWTPEWMKLRMKSWLESISDWPVSRKRYWGTPLPIWICEKCGKKLVIGSISELKKYTREEINLHKPEIDLITIKCSCKGIMKRVPEVLDVWFDAGVSSWAALGYTADKKNFEKFWPADLNIEGKDQIRGWWNSQLILSEIKFGKKPFDNIFVHGMVLDLGKKKMSKSLGNIVSPHDIINLYGRDCMRYYFAKLSKGEDFAFDKKEFEEIQKTFRFLLNIDNFINQIDSSKSKSSIEDKWILSRFNSLIKSVTSSYKKFRFYEVINLTEDFIVFDLSRTYIQAIRDRSDEVFNVLNEIRIGLLKMLAPIIPFTTENIWQELKQKKLVKEESIHLSDFPKENKRMIDEKLEESFKILSNIVEKGLAERKKAEIGLRWPLSSAEITSKANVSALKELFMNQLNIKDIKIKIGKENSIKLNTKITDELEAEGYARESIRCVQDARKKANLVKGNKIDLDILVNQSILDMLRKHASFIKQKTNATHLSLLDIKENVKSRKHVFDAEIKDKKIKVMFDVL